MGYFILKQQLVHGSSSCCINNGFFRMLNKITSLKTAINQTDIAVICPQALLVNINNRLANNWKLMNMLMAINMRRQKACHFQKTVNLRIQFRLYGFL